MWSLIQTIFTFALVLGGMVVIHEFGHFIVAKSFGIRVDVFSVGFGKRLFGIKKGDTDYRLSLIPLGGYVKMAGENLDEKVTGAPDEFMSKPKWQRFCVAVAGPAMNILTALAIPMGLAMVSHEVPAYLEQPPVISAVEPESTADKAGLQRGDRIVKLDGQENLTWRDVEDLIALNPDSTVPVTVNRGGETKELMLPIGSLQLEEKIGYAGIRPDAGPNAKIVVAQVSEGTPASAAGLKQGDQIVAVNGTPVEQNFYGRDTIIRAIRTSNGQPMTLTVVRDGQATQLTATPEKSDGDYRLGFYQVLTGVETINERLGLAGAFEYSVKENLRILKLTKATIAKMFTGQRSARDTLTGPIGIFTISGQAAEQGAASVFQLMALLSLNLGIFNLLPIPVLDGGLIFMLGLEAFLALFGLPLTLRVKERMMQVGFVMLMLLMGFVIFNDISKKIPSRAAPQAEQAKPANK